MHQENAIFKSYKGTTLDAERVKRPLSQSRPSEPNLKQNGIKIKFKEDSLEDSQMTSKDFKKNQNDNSGLSGFLGKTYYKHGDLNVSLDQINLLEILGILVKYNAEYYPDSIQDVEYFVKNQFEGGYLNHYTKGIRIEKIENKVKEEVKSYGLAAYRNDLHLTEREECIVLMEWLRKMKKKFGSSTYKIDTKLRNTELLLSFCIGELIRMCKIECNERANALQFVWESMLEFTQALEQRYALSQKETLTKMSDEFENAKTNMENKISQQAEELKQSYATIQTLNETLKPKEAELQTLKISCQDYKDRCMALSGILDHIVSKNVNDLKKISAKNKKYNKPLVEIGDNHFTTNEKEMLKPEEKPITKQTTVQIVEKKAEIIKEEKKEEKIQETTKIEKKASDENKSIEINNEEEKQIVIEAKAPNSPKILQENPKSINKEGKFIL